MATAVFYSGKKSPHSAIKQPLVGVMFTLYSAYRDATEELTPPLPAPQKNKLPERRSII